MPDVANDRPDRPDGRDPDVNKGEGDTPAMNLPGPKADTERATRPVDLFVDAPEPDEPQSLEGAVRREGHPQNGEPAQLPHHWR